MSNFMFPTSSVILSLTCCHVLRRDLSDHHRLPLHDQFLRRVDASGRQIRQTAQQRKKTQQRSNSHVTNRTSYVTRRTSYVIRHTSYVIRYKSVCASRGCGARAGSDGRAAVLSMDRRQPRFEKGDHQCRTEAVARAISSVNFHDFLRSSRVYRIVDNMLHIISRVRADGIKFAGSARQMAVAGKFTPLTDEL